MIGDVVDSVDVFVYTMPTDGPEADGTLSWDSTTMITDNLAKLVRGRSALDVGGSFDAMVKAVRNEGRPGAAGYAISALDVALGALRPGFLTCRRTACLAPCTTACRYTGAAASLPTTSVCFVTS